MESQRLGSQLNILNAEIAHSKSLISQEQKALRKELAQIREVKDNPIIGLERRKRLQQISSRESQTCRHDLSVEPQVTLSRFRSQSTGHPPMHSCQLPSQSRFRSLSTGHPPRQSSQLPSLKGRQRSKSTTCPPLRLGVEELSQDFRGQKESGTLHDINNNTPAQEVRTDARQNQKVRSLSTGTPPPISAWVKDTNDEVASNTKIDGPEVSIFTNFQSWQKSNWCQDRIKLECGHSTNWVWKEQRRDTSDQNNANEALSKVKINATMRLIPPDFKPAKQGRDSHAPSKHASTRRERRCYSTNSTPIISEGRVVGLSDKTTTVPQHVDTVSQRRCVSTSQCNPKARDKEKFAVPNDNAVRKQKAKKFEHQSLSSRDFREKKNNGNPQQ